MVNIIESVVEICLQEPDLIVAPADGSIFLEFVRRQLEKHQGYDLNFDGGRSSLRGERFPYFSFFADSLRMFMILIRQRKIKNRVEYKEGTLVDTDEKLKLLRVRGRHPALWEDDLLFDIYDRRERGKKGFEMLRYTELFGDVGGDPGVIAVWDRKLRYEVDVKGRTRKLRSRLGIN